MVNWKIVKTEEIWCIVEKSDERWREVVECLEKWWKVVKSSGYQIKSLPLGGGVIRVVGGTNDCCT